MVETRLHDDEWSLAVRYLAIGECGGRTVYFKSLVTREVLGSRHRRVTEEVKVIIRLVDLWAQDRALRVLDHALFPGRRAAIIVVADRIGRRWVERHHDVGRMAGKCEDVIRCGRHSGINVVALSGKGSDIGAGDMARFADRKAV